jgi:hypothetical protein
MLEPREREINGVGIFKCLLQVKVASVGLFGRLIFKK